MTQFFSKEAFNDRMLLFETTDFTTTADQMIDLLARIVSDRALGRMFFNNYYLMDVELVSNEIERPHAATAPGLDSLAFVHCHRGRMRETRPRGPLAATRAFPLPRVALAHRRQSGIRPQIASRGAQGLEPGWVEVTKWDRVSRAVADPVCHELARAGHRIGAR